MIEWTEIEREPDGRIGYKAGTCGRCNRGKVEWFRGMDDCDPCTHCDAEHNSAGQLLRDNWRANMSNYDDEISDMDGYEREMLDAERGHP